MDQHLIPNTPPPARGLLQLLSNTLVLQQTAPYLPISSKLALAATSKSFRDLVYSTKDVFRHCDLGTIKSALNGTSDSISPGWIDIEDRENWTRENFWARPVSVIFQRLETRHVLQNVHTLVLDGCYVGLNVIHQIIIGDKLNVRILSIRQVRELDYWKLQEALRYAVRPTRPVNTPRLKGLYVFGVMDQNRKRKNIYLSETYSSANRNISDQCFLLASPHGNEWFGDDGLRYTALLNHEWANTIEECHGIISFDLPLCRGPRHAHAKATSRAFPLDIATEPLTGCSGCNAAPEGFLTLNRSFDDLPLLAPIPLQCSTVKAAKTPAGVGSGPEKKLLMRCGNCLRDRYCHKCFKWWCEECYQPGLSEPQAENLEDGTLYSGKLGKYGATRDCFECGYRCEECMPKTQMICVICGGGYCLVHNEGSNITTASRHAINACR
ncbi:hypothetical protein BJ878DRAFT_286855 [Calycina marina]|uniref:Uncharacterized protein n=1 Tax=Calycina marina TaxID=1763456 RepID=A0A9P7ZBR8_9HELO|nr:hypothetical protein BJ878DRAFT_286855 [Calycina marina]